MTPSQQALLQWYWQNRRNLPWRGQTDPYRILLSEVLLQQTRVEQAIPFYQRFLQRFPSLNSLAAAPLEDVLLVWQGAGYYSRARNLHRLSQGLTNWPQNAAALCQLPGVGPYTAAAVASIAFGQAVAAVDGNVRRVFSRLMAWSNPTPQEVQTVANAWLVHQHPGDWNQALMELGATVCTPKKPLCPQCPLSGVCMGQNQPLLYPQAKSKKVKEVQLAALVLYNPSGVVLEARTSRSLGGLWGVPSAPTLVELLQRFGLQQAQALGVVHHAFTHRKLNVEVFAAPYNGPTHHPLHKPLAKLDRKILGKAQSLLGHLGIISGTQHTQT